jgi:hypothetical protein
MQYYENGLIYKPLYESTVDGFQKGVQSGSVVKVPDDYSDMFLIVNITETQYSDIISKYKKLNLINYVIKPDNSEIWLIFDHFYVKVSNITGKFQQALALKKLQCIFSCKNSPLLMPFLFQ